MTWSYNLDQDNNKDRLRFIIGDTDNDRQLLSDEELIAVLARHSQDLTLSAIELAEHLEAKFVRRAESRSGDIIADFLTVAGKYRELANRLRKKGVKGYAQIYTADRENELDQDSIEKPSIALGEFDVPGS